MTTGPALIWSDTLDFEPKRLNVGSPLPELKVSIAEARERHSIVSRNRQAAARASRRVRGVVEVRPRKAAKVVRRWGPAENRGLYEACRAYREEWLAFVRRGRNPLAKKTAWTGAGV